jgi:hypothetical protein
MGRTEKKLIMWFVALGLLCIMVVSLAACAGPQGPAGPQGSPGPSGPPGPAATAAAGAFSVTDTQIKTTHNSLTLSQIAEIQPGLGTIMIEYAQRMDNLWFAGQKSNWSMVTYQIDEMREIQETGETTRSSRAPLLKAFEASSLDPIAKAAANKDLAAFTTAYDNAIAGCNGCHAGSSGTAADGSPIPSYKFVKIVRPTASDFNNVDWAGQ